ncbi:lysine 5,6-aminomutase reactivase subunit KamB [Risungbinella massiliensis]|uniref:lysine 5,6-aminomutase reactivase subunit KamB n=1 Tax=Risungbinella massiliensis TaxID=1329796 RepID=UPI0011CC7365|nr:hypothetical protein [Risungbinella massiliensis]
MEILRLFPGKSLAFVGLSKNAGKTTAMCQVARTLNGIHQLGLVSIGVDGEKKDVWSGRSKPAVWVPKGGVVATAAPFLSEHKESWKILDWMESTSLLGPLIIAKAMEETTVTLAGVTNIRQLQDVQNKMWRLGVTLLLQDGAYDRRAMAGISCADGVILIAGASGYSHPQALAKKVEEWLSSYCLPRFASHALLDSSRKKKEYLLINANGETLLSHLDQNSILAMLCSHASLEESILYFPGALTTRLYERISSFGIQTIVLEDPTHLFVPPNIFQAKEKTSVQVLYLPQLLLIGYNPYSVDGFVWNSTLVKREIELVAKSFPVVDFQKY